MADAKSVVDPTFEDAYWSEHYRSRPYYEKSIPYDVYGAAYQHGWEARAKYSKCAYEAIEAELKEEWKSAACPIPAGLGSGWKGRPRRLGAD